MIILEDLIEGFINRRRQARLSAEKQQLKQSLITAINSMSGVWSVTRHSDGAVFLVYGPDTVDWVRQCLPEGWRDHCTIEHVHSLFDEKGGLYV